MIELDAHERLCWIGLFIALAQLTPQQIMCLIRVYICLNATEI
jgi:hypothetical protein